MQRVSQLWLILRIIHKIKELKAIHNVIQTLARTLILRIIHKIKELKAIHNP